MITPEELGTPRPGTHTPELVEFEHHGIVYVRDTRLEHLRAIEEQVHEQVGGLLLKHVDAEDSPLTLIPYEPDEHPEMRMDVISMRSTQPSSIAELEGMAEMAYAGFPELKQQYSRREDLKMFALIAEDLAAGMDYIFTFDHSRIDNIAHGAVATLGAIARGAAFNEREMPHFVRRMTVSKILTRASAMGLPVSDILVSLGVLDFSLPPSETLRKAGISDPVRAEINTAQDAARKEVDEAAKRSEPKIATADFIAPSGTADVQVSWHFGRHRRVGGVHMGPLSRGTAEMLGKARILSASVNVDKPKPRSAIGTVLNPPKTMAGAHDVMNRQAKLSKRATRRRHVYHPDSKSFVEATGK